MLQEGGKGRRGEKEGGLLLLSKERETPIRLGGSLVQTKRGKRRLHSGEAASRAKGGEGNSASLGIVYSVPCHKEGRLPRRGVQWIVSRKGILG